MGGIFHMEKSDSKSKSRSTVRVAVKFVSHASRCFATVRFHAMFECSRALGTRGGGANGIKTLARPTANSLLMAWVAACASTHGAVKMSGYIRLPTGVS